jgi:hypothetical protein
VPSPAPNPGEVVFKGGTSLEKLRIIRCFSEDLDLSVVGDYASNRAAERALKSMVEAAASGTLGGPTGGRSGGKPGSFHRTADLAPPMAHSAAPGAIADASAILIELGQSGGPNPHETERGLPRDPIRADLWVAGREVTPSDLPRTFASLR